MCGNEIAQHAAEKSASFSRLRNFIEVLPSSSYRVPIQLGVCIGKYEGERGAGSVGFAHPFPERIQEVETLDIGLGLIASRAFSPV